MLDTMVTCDASVAARFLEQIRGSPPQRRMIVGLDIEWKKLDGGNFTTALLQLCVGSCVLVFQVLYATGGDLPAVLKSFLTEEDHIFTGAHIGNDVYRLQDNFGITISHPVDLQFAVPEADPSYVYKVRRSSLEKIASEVLRLPRLSKPVVDHGTWDACYLRPSQVEYAAVDAYLSYEIANQLEIRHGYRFIKEEL